MAIEYSNFNLTAGNAVRYWQLSDITAMTRRTRRWLAKWTRFSF